VLTAGQTDDGLPNYTMPFVTGESLRARMGRGGLGRLSQARELASQAWSMSPAVRAAVPRVGIELAAGDTSAARRVAEQAMRDLPTDQVLGDLGSNALGWVASAEAFRARGAAALDLVRRAIATERLAGGAVSRNLPDLLFFAAEAAVVAGERDAAEEPRFEPLLGAGRPRSSPAR
jgi:hypothetical protein